MHAVLDGEADAGETADLERHLAGDPAAREEFDELRRLFDGLSRIPKAFPPEGLVASVMAQLPQPTERTRPPPPTFLAATCNWTRFRGRPRIQSRGYQQGSLGSPGKGPNFRSDDMSEEKSGSFGKRKMWIGGGIAAVAVVLATLFRDRFPAGQQGYGGHDRAGAAVSGASKHGG